MNSFLQKVSESDFFRVVCVGDSQSAQAFSYPRWSDWVKYVVSKQYDKQKQWRFQVVNNAVNGATPQHVATYLSHYVTQFRPDLVIVSFGDAPLDAMFTEANFIAEFTMLMQSLKKSDCSIAIWSPIPHPSGVGRESTLAITTFFEQISKDIGVTYVDIYHEIECYDRSMLFTDIGRESGVQLNKTGNFIVAKKILSTLFSLSMPEETEGDFVVPNVEQLKSWRR